MCLGTDVIEYFKALAKETGVPYQKMNPISRRSFLKLAGYTGMIGLVASYSPVSGKSMESPNSI